MTLLVPRILDKGIQPIFEVSRESEQIGCESKERENFKSKNWLTKLWSWPVQNLHSEPRKWRSGKHRISQFNLEIVCYQKSLHFILLMPSND